MQTNKVLLMYSVALLACAACSSIKERIDPEESQSLLETKQEQCTQEFVRVLGMQGGVKIARGESKEIYFDGAQSEILWFCERGNGADLKKTSMPVQSNRVVVSRSASDALTMQFYRQTPAPSGDRVLLKTEELECSSEVVRFVGSHGSIDIKRDESEEVPIASQAGEVIWYCDTTHGAADNGGSHKTTAPGEANRIVVTRPQSGDAFVVQFFRE